MSQIHTDGAGALLLRPGFRRLGGSNSGFFCLTKSKNETSNLVLAGPSAHGLDGLDLHLGDARLAKTKRVGGAPGHVDDPPAGERPAIVDRDDHGALIAEIGHQRLGAKR